jgi:hypothetical protein
MRRFLVLLALSLTACGCGQDGPPRYAVSGTVTYGGRPVRAGQVIFEPAASQGNSGPAGYAEIVGGKYHTLSDKGVVGGPHQVRVICLGDDDNFPEGQMVCPEYTATIDLPQDDFEYPIEVPGDLRW